MYLRGDVVQLPRPSYRLRRRSCGRVRRSHRPHGVGRRRRAAAARHRRDRRRSDRRGADHAHTSRNRRGTSGSGRDTTRGTDQFEYPSTGRDTRGRPCSPGGARSRSPQPAGPPQSSHPPRARMTSGNTTSDNSTGITNQSSPSSPAPPSQTLVWNWYWNCDGVPTTPDPPPTPDPAAGAVTIVWNWHWDCPDAPPPQATVTGTTVCVACNIAISVRVASPGDSAGVTQTTGTDVSSIATGVATAAQAAAQVLPEAAPQQPAVPPPAPPLPAIPQPVSPRPPVRVPGRRCRRHAALPPAVAIAVPTLDPEAEDPPRHGAPGSYGATAVRHARRAPPPRSIHVRAAFQRTTVRTISVVHIRTIAVTHGENRSPRCPPSARRRRPRAAPVPAGAAAGASAPRRCARADRDARHRRLHDFRARRRCARRVPSCPPRLPRARTPDRALTAGTRSSGSAWVTPLLGYEQSGCGAAAASTFAQEEQCETSSVCSWSSWPRAWQRLPRLPPTRGRSRSPDSRRARRSRQPQPRARHRSTRVTRTSRSGCSAPATTAR